jgi:membrane associated rhomboid family serine protease
MPLPLHDERGPPPPGGSEAVWSQLWRSRARWRDVKRSLLVAVHGSPVFRAAASVRDELRAHLTWGFGRVLAPTSRVPLPAEWDSRHAVALLELARTLSDTARAAGVDGHADAWLALPPVTAALCFAQLLVFFRPGGVRLADVSLSPYCVVERRELSRLVTAALVHVDAPHLIANLSAALPDCVALEVAYGSTPLAADLLLLTLGAHGLYVAAAWAQARLFVRRSQYYSLVVVGFSGAAFALKVCWCVSEWRL